MILSVDNVLDDPTEELCLDGHQDRIKKDCEELPPHLVLLLFFTEVNHVNQFDAEGGTGDSKTTEKEEYEEV